MNLTEIKKGEADIQRGKVLMAIEGEEQKVMTLVKTLKGLGYEFTDCAEESECGELIVVFFIVDRLDVKDFRVAYKANKGEK